MHSENMPVDMSRLYWHIPTENFSGACTEQVHREIQQEFLQSWILLHAANMLIKEERYYFQFHKFHLSPIPGWHKKRGAGTAEQKEVDNMVSPSDLPIHVFSVGLDLDNLPVIYILTIFLVTLRQWNGIRFLFRQLFAHGRKPWWNFRTILLNSFIPNFHI